MSLIVEGHVRVPPSKSVTHRAYVLAARADRPCQVTHPLRAADPDATLAALISLGARADITDGGVSFTPAAFLPPGGALDLRNAGTGLRLLAAQAATQPFPVTFTGDASLRSRPHGPLLDALRAGGARISETEPGAGRAPFTVQGPIRPGPYAVPAAASSQYASALLLALPLLNGNSALRLEAPVSSRPYVDITLRLAAAAGLAIDEPAAGSFHIEGGQCPRIDALDVEGDWSAAAFLVAAAAVTGGAVTLQGLDERSAQGDRVILDLAAQFGTTSTRRAGAIRVEGGPLASPGVIDVSQTPDLLPALAVMAAYGRGTTRFVGAAALRDKECDRLHAMAAGLTAMGLEVAEEPDALAVTGGRPRGATIHAFHDHRIHMAFAVAGLASDGPVKVDGRESIAISYPSFYDDLDRLTEVA